MFLDARDLEAGALLAGDVCIVGAGPAGLTLARELAARGHDVLLLESGGLTEDPRTQALADGETVGDEYQPLVDTRARRFGGTSHFWNSGRGHGQVGFRVGPLADIDFERREWLPHSVGWPFGLETLEPYYRRVHEAAKLAPFAYAGRAWERGRAACLPVDEALLPTSVWHFGVAESFTEEPQADVAASRRITACLWANVVALETDETGRRVTGLRAACLDGKRFRVAARTVVLAAGGIENARLLLLSTDVQSQGIGNAHGLVGRYFMEHQMVKAGRLVPTDRSLYARCELYDTRNVDGRLMLGKLDLSSSAMRRERLLNGSAAFVPQHRLNHRARDSAVQATITLARHAMRGRVPAGAGALLREAVTYGDYVAATVLRKLSGRRLFPYYLPSPDLVAGATWSALPDQHRRWDWLDVTLHMEQAPHPDNRVTLGERRDALGLPLPRLHWRWNEVDVDTVLRFERLLAAELERAGVGRLELRLDDGRPHLHHPGLHHHMGTTRMHVDPAQGVVDAHGRVHGVDNLYVAGCSVFPSGGYINPTLTILALAIRQADELASRLGAPSPTVAAHRDPEAAQPHA